MLPDLDSPDNIKRFIDIFYQTMLKDKQLAPIFTDVAQIDLNKHKPIICSYWEKLLLGEKNYNRHTMNIHRAVHHKRQFEAADFQQWLMHFRNSLTANFQGPYADRALKVATSIASNMEKNI